MVFEKDVESSLDGQEKQCGSTENGGLFKNAYFYNQKEAVEIPGPCIEREQLGNELFAWNNRRNQSERRAKNSRGRKGNNILPYGHCIIGSVLS